MTAARVTANLPATSAPRATYRLQLRGGMTFARAAELAPYLARLGISHLYLSPIFNAVPGSTHGYDGIDFNAIEPELGGYDGFVALSREMQAAGVRIILDIVPNHMGASPLNAWWRDALEWGAASPYAGHFDVDWSAPKLIVPRLGDHYGAVLKSGALQLRVDSAAGELSIAYGDMLLPLNPPSYAGVLSAGGEDHFGALALRFATSSPAGVGELKAALAGALADPEAAASLERAARDISGEWEALHRLHEQQVWRLAHWRAARENLTYRRFFEIAELVGVRVEQPNVFEDVHRTALALVQKGLVDGLRIDHIDGLADPLAYLTRLRKAVGRDDFYIVVEKILGPDEELRSDWPVAGTTGYEVINDLARLMVDENCRAQLQDAYARFIGEQRDLTVEVLSTKRRTITRNLAGELDYLTSLASSLAAGDIATRDIGADTLRRAIVELASAMPVYRTYVDAGGAKPEDVTIILDAIAAAKASREVEDEAAFEFLTRLFALDVGSADRQAAALLFVTRFQQTSGPLTAKALEDTLFYRYNRLIAVNEVGGEPDPLGAPIADFHRAMQDRLESAPLALSATATHDTKRGEDARARIYAISEAPDVWSAAVRRWSAMNVRMRTENVEGIAPGAEAEWMFYQALLGAWPAALTPADAAGLDELAQRMGDYMRKAAREAKLHTTWTQPVEDYEAAVDAFVTNALAPSRSRAFLQDFHATVQPFILAGAVNSLTQLCVKLFAPGIPDIYQGTEIWDLALVDPDNRRTVDFVERMAMTKAEATPAELAADWTTGAVKLQLMRAGLALRREVGDEFAAADYVPLEVEGPLRRHVVAFARSSAAGWVVIVGTRFSLRLLEGGMPVVPAHRWQGTRVRLPASVTQVNDVAAHRTIVVEQGGIELSEVLRDLPVAMLRS
jgi:(1->4)-alpha-D-glucan 1-alpha-D-glucosylmutase